MAGDLFMGDLKGIRLLQDAFLQKEARQPFIEALPHHLVHEPHDIRKPGCHDLAGIVGHHGRPLHQPLIKIRRDDPELRVLLRRDEHVKLETAHDAGSRKQADIPLKQPVQSDLPPLFGDHMGPELAGGDHQQAGAYAVSAMEKRAFWNPPLHRRIIEPFLVCFVQLVINGKILGYGHGLPPPVLLYAPIILHLRGTVQMLFLFFQTEKQARRFLRMACFSVAALICFCPGLPSSWETAASGSKRLEKRSRMADPQASTLRNGASLTRRTVWYYKKFVWIPNCLDDFIILSPFLVVKGFSV